MTLEYRYLRKAAPEARDDGKLYGRAWVYNSHTQIGKAPWGFRETIRASAGKKSVNDGDIVLLDNHETRLPLARMSAGTLVMRDTKNGGDWEATPADTTYGNDVRKNVKAGNYGGCSFGFEVLKDIWTDDDGNPSDPMNGTNREIVEMKVHEISVCTFPAYTATSVSARAQVDTARGAMEERLKTSEIGDIQKMSPHDVDPLIEEEDEEDEDQQDDTNPGDGSARASDQPYGDVTYADPGYQKDGKKRYPLNNKKRAKAAWSYINQAKNAAKYTAQQLASIKSKIRSALKKFGVKISDDEKKLEEWAALCDFREMTEGYDPEDENYELDFGVMPAHVARLEDVNMLARAIKEANSTDSRKAAIDMAANFGLPDMLPEHWSALGEIASGAPDETLRDMDTIYTLAMGLPPTRTALDIMDVAQAYLTLEAQQEKRQQQEKADEEEQESVLANLTLQEARKRLQDLQSERSTQDRMYR